MHVDGGAMAQVFLYPPSINVAKAGGKPGLAERKGRAYIIRNSRLDADWADVERKAMSIIARAISSLINTQGWGT